MTNATFVMHDASGRIVQTGYGNPALQVVEGLSVLVCDIPDRIDEHVVRDGVIVRMSDDELHQMRLPAYWRNFRLVRDRMLQKSDWTQVPDAPVDRAAWAEYRQALRDLPANTTDPRNPNWPTTP